MTKKDYIKFADMMARRHPGFDWERGELGEGEYMELLAMWNGIINDMILLFRLDNSKFNGDTFRKYINKQIMHMSNQSRGWRTLEEMDT